MADLDLNELERENAVLRERIAELEVALKGMTDHYCELVLSGEAGIWNPEDEDQVKAARAALAKGGGVNLTEKRIKANAYSRGYAAGMKRAWPDWAPPNPPHEQVAALFRAADDLRQAAFGLLAVCIADDGPDGPFVTLEREANNVDKAFSEIGRWLKDLPVPERDSKEEP